MGDKSPSTFLAIKWDVREGTSTKESWVFKRILRIEVHETIRSANFIGMKRILITCLFSYAIIVAAFAQHREKVIWSIGKPDHSASEFALAPNGFKDFVGHDFGYPGW